MQLENAVFIIPKKCSDYLKIFLIMLSATKGLFPKKSTYR